MAAVAVAVLTALAALGLAQPSSAAQGTGPCPRSNALRQFRAADNVGATYTVSGHTTTYTFYSFTDEHPTNGVPGLVDYCVYPSTRPRTVSPEARGANGQQWLSAIGSNNFAFQRPDGNPSNIPLNGQVTQMGTATWRNSAPRAQTILLHINDPAVCARIYGDDPGTCFVKPSNNPQQPICNRGASDMAYNAMPYGVTDCYTAALGFEAQSVNEFGDEVALAGTGRRLDTLQVMFASYACQSGSWTSRCTSAPGATFDHPITANVYAPDDLTHPLATLTRTVTFPYRPSSDPANCPRNPSQWYNPAGNRCQNSIGTVVTFDFSGQTLPDQVVWTVAFNTSHSGYDPIGTAACSTEPGGCPYDSLNVGATSFPNAPYAGTDVDPDIAYLSTPPITGTLRPDSGFADFRPLGAITTTT
ncbi:hypothetical protein [Streptomyces sp. NPDC086766]|uniref:hypothetical protein n=1 Tax=Streptomyces sp. NPDC086766 TaxID=3365754 RepID=UPI00380744D9